MFVSNKRSDGDGGPPTKGMVVVFSLTREIMVAVFFQHEECLCCKLMVVLFHRQMV